MSFAVAKTSTTMVGLGRTAAALEAATELLPIGGPDAKLSSLYGAIQGWIMAEPGEVPWEVAKGTFLGWFITVVAEKLRDWQPTGDFERFAGAAKFVQRIARVVAPQIGPAGMEATVGAAVGVLTGLFCGKGFAGRLWSALKEGVKNFFIWGVVQLAVQNSLDLAEFADGRTALGDIPDGYPAWEELPPEERPVFAVRAQGERLPATGGVWEEHQRCREAVVSKGRLKLFDDTEAEVRQAIWDGCARFGIDPPGMTHNVYLVGKQPLLPMRPRDRFAYSMDLNQESYARLKAINLVERASPDELTEAMTELLIKAELGANTVQSNGNVMRLRRGFAIRSSEERQRHAESDREAASRHFDDSAVKFVAHLFHGRPLNPWNKGTKRFDAVYQALGEEQGREFVRMLVESRRIDGDALRVLSFLKAVQGDAKPACRALINDLKLEVVAGTQRPPPERAPAREAHQPA